MQGPPSEAVKRERDTRILPRAFVMINVKVGTDRDVVGELKALRYVDKVYEVYGVYDIIAEVKAETMEALKDTVNAEMRKLKSVLSTNTIIVAEA
jgi:DNA-binding Lrp family transcriptional regulator